MSKPSKEVPVSVDDHAHRVHPGSQPSFIRSFTHALHGVVHVLKHERNARLHLMFALMAFLLGVLLQVSDVELAAVFFAVIIVFLAEIFNTAIERTLDLVDPKENARVKIIKDMAAGGVLVAAAAAAAIGLAIFGPYITRYIWAI